MHLFSKQTASQTFYSVKTNEGDIKNLYAGNNEKLKLERYYFEIELRGDLNSSSTLLQKSVVGNIKFRVYAGDFVKSRIFEGDKK